MSFMGNLSGVYGERVGVARQEEKLLSWYVLVLRYFTRAALQRREDWKFHARAPVQTTLCIGKNMKKSKTKMIIYMENAHRKEECVFLFGVSQRTCCSAAGQLSSFRVACVADRVSSRKKIKFF